MMEAICNMTGKMQSLPCATPTCPFFGDCMALYQSQFVEPDCICKGITSMSGALNGTGPVADDKEHLRSIDYDGDFNFCPICGRYL